MYLRDHFPRMSSLSLSDTGPKTFRPILSLEVDCNLLLILVKISKNKPKNPATDASHLKARRDEFWFNRFWVGDETIFYVVES